MPHGHPVYTAMRTTIFEYMSGLSRELGAINLGQGFPDGNGPPELREAAARALMDRSNQYPPSAGVPELRDAVAAFYRKRQGLDLTRDEVIVTSGATEGIAVAVMALVQPGDEVILFAPAYDAYAPMVRRCGGVPVFVPLAPPGWSYDAAAIRAAITPRTRGMMLSDPLNPAGTVASEADLAMLAHLCTAHDLWAICDEVWEMVRFDGHPHRSLRSLPGMAERTVKIGSAGKIFGLTGWKIGWLVAAPELARLLARAHQFLTFTTPPALQWAVAEGLAMPAALLDGILAEWTASRSRLAAGLTRAGFAVLPNAATWFLCVDLAASGIALDDASFSERLIREAGVASIPASALFEGTGAPAHIVRFCFTKPDAMLDEACQRLAMFRSRLG
ncbi:MAG: aminotransferase [Sphingomonadales bacterium]|nr:aminotransferase [Sphingomonadales bacterium]